MRQLSWQEFAHAEGATYTAESTDFPRIELTCERAVELHEAVFYY